MRHGPRRSRLADTRRPQRETVQTTPIGLGDSSPSPTEMVIHAHAACSLIDVIDGLKHRIANVEYATVEIEVEMAEKVPKVFTSVNMKYIIKGDVPEALVRRLIESSHERYCRIGIMITRSGASLDWSLDIRP